MTLPPPRKSRRPVTVLIVNYNSWQHLVDCLDALEHQTFSDFDTLVIDNGSEQAAPETLSRIACRPRTRLICNDDNEGFAAANNRLMAVLDDESWVILLNPDTRPRADWMERLLHAAERHPDYQCFSSRLTLARDPARLDGDGDAYHVSGLVWRNRHGLPADPTEATEVFSPCAAAAMYRVDAVRAVGGFDRDFFCYVEDVDLGFRLRLAGSRCLLVPDSVVDHWGSGSSNGPYSDFAIYHGHRNLVWCYVKNMPPLLFWSMLPLHLLMNLVSLVWFGIRGQTRIIWRSKRDAVRGLPHMWNKRRRIQSERRIATADIWRLLDKSLLPWTRHYRRTT